MLRRTNLYYFVNFQSRFTDVIVGIFFFRFFNSDKVKIVSFKFTNAFFALPFMDY